MTGVEITQTEMARWQRRAAGHLTAILRAHAALPVIGWTVGAAGSTVTGQVNGLLPHGQTRRLFHAWQAALMLGDIREATSGTGTAYLHAEAHRDGVRVQLSAAVFDDEDRQAGR